MDLNPANVAIGGVILVLCAVFAFVANIVIVAIYTRKNMRSPINTILTGKYFQVLFFLYKNLLIIKITPLIFFKLK